MQLGQIPVGNECPKCKGQLERRERQFYFRGRWFAGLVCQPCNAGWNVPDKPGFWEWAVEASRREKEGES
jgi:hypothetical protein